MSVEPVKTTIPFHRRVLKHPDFVAGRYSTHFVEQVFSDHKTTGELVGT